MPNDRSEFWHPTGSKSLAEGMKVDYEVEEGPKGLQARGVSVATSV
jgi:cold shock CspA family protein